MLILCLTWFSCCYIVGSKFEETHTEPPMNTALALPDFTASEAIDEFNEDPIACIEDMIRAEMNIQIRLANAQWISDWIDTKQHDKKVADIRNQQCIQLAQAMKEIVSESWQSNDVRETSQSVRDQWLDKWVAFKGGRS